uniref:Uncharacterized protein n=1 Tax=Anguilla anguilla TaxID=7936 RepID=A0A0E9PEM2_ANGAN
MAAFSNRVTRNGNNESDDRAEEQNKHV